MIALSDAAPFDININWCRCGLKKKMKKKKANISMLIWHDGAVAGNQELIRKSVGRSVCTLNNRFLYMILLIVHTKDYNADHFPLSFQNPEGAGRDNLGPAAKLQVGACRLCRFQKGLFTATPEAF